MPKPGVGSGGEGRGGGIEGIFAISVPGGQHTRKSTLLG